MNNQFVVQVSPYKSRDEKTQYDIIDVNTTRREYTGDILECHAWLELYEKGYLRK